MNILYLSSVVILIITFLLFKKTDKKLNLISSFCITIILFLAYQAILAYFLDLIKIPISLYTMSVINISIIIRTLDSYNFKNKENSMLYN